MKAFYGLAISLCITGSVVGCVAAPTPAQLTSADYGAPPTRYEDAIRGYFDSTLKDPSSIQYREVSAPEKGYVQAAPIAGGGITYGWLVNATINGKNSYGAYVGFRTYSFLFRGDELMNITPPPLE